MSSDVLVEARIERHSASHEDVLAERYGFTTKEVQAMDTMVMGGLAQLARREEKAQKVKQ